MYIDIKWLRLAVVTLIMCATICAKSSPKPPDILIVEGDTLYIMGKPLYSIDEETLNKWKSIEQSKKFWISYDDWGYHAYWKLEDGKLIFDGMNRVVYDPATDTYTDQKIDPDMLEQPFSKYYDDGQIFATWYTGPLRTASGKCLKYVHDPYMSLYEDEKFFEIKDGILTTVSEYHNHLLPGITMEEAYDIFTERFPYHEFAKYAPARFTLLVSMDYDETTGRTIVSDVELPKCRVALTEEDKEKLLMAVRQTINNIEPPIESLYYMGKHQPLDQRYIMTLILRDEILAFGFQGIASFLDREDFY